VIRTVLLTVLCLSGAGGVVAINAGTSTPPPIAAASPEQTIADEIFSQDTLTEADRLEIVYVRDAPAAEPAVAVARAPGETSPQPAASKPAPRVVKSHRHDPGATKSATASTGRSSKRQEQKQVRNVTSRKPTVELKACRRPEGFAEFLRALNLTPSCDT
jgi:hypothetical protein